MLFLCFETTIRGWDLYRTLPVVDLPGHLLAGRATTALAYGVLKRRRSRSPHRAATGAAFGLALAREATHVLRQKVSPDPRWPRDAFWSDAFIDLVVAVLGSLVVFPLPRWLRGHLAILRPMDVRLACGAGLTGAHPGRVFILMIPSRPAGALMVLGVLAGVAGCGRADAPTAPRAPLSLSIRVVNQLPPRIAVLAEGPIIQCGVDLEATVHGPGRARFEGATFRWYAGVDRVPILDSLRIPGWQARAAWTADTLSAARVETTSWDISARAPFDAEIRFHYRDVGTNATGTASTRFTCGPTLPAGGAPAPTVAVLEVTTRPELEPGDTVRVTYLAQSSVGLWTTEANAESAFALRRHFAELMGPVALREALFEVPRGATLGVPLAFAVQAADVALQTTTTRVETTMRVVDRRPPVIVSHGPLSGDFTVGQQFPITVRATDNNQLAWLVYEFGAPVNLVDSVRVAADVPASDWNVPLLVRPTWVGTPSLTVFVRDAAGNASLPLQSPTGALRFLAAP